MEKRHVVVKAMRWLAEALTELSFVLPKPTHIPEALGAVDEALALVRATGDRATEQQLVVFHSDLNDALAEHKRWMEQQMLIRPTRQKLHVAEVAKVEAAIKAALTAYYAAGNWEERYRTAVPGEDVKKMMSSLYEDVDWVSVQWSVVKMPSADELAAAAGEGQRVRIETLTNGNPHSIFLVFAQGRWRVDWMQSLNILWLSK